MNISSTIKNLYGNVAIDAPTSTGLIGPPSQGTTVNPATAIGAAATASISTGGQLFSEMQQLSQQNPAEFKAVAKQVAASFQQAASQASGQQAKSLTDLANLFGQAAQTGTLSPAQSVPSTSSAQPGQAVQVAQAVQGSQAAASAGTQHHHHHHGGGSSAGQGSDVQQAFQNAMSILTQALQGTSASASTGSPVPSSSST